MPKNDKPNNKSLEKEEKYIGHDNKTHYQSM